MSLEDNIKDSMVALLKQCGLDAVKVTAYEDDTYSSGHCETCYYETAAVTIYFTTSKGTTETYTYLGDFGELIYELDRLS